MAYEHDPITGRTTAERHDTVRPTGSRSPTPWLVAAAVVVALIALLWIFGGTGQQTPATTGAPATTGEVAPTGTAPAGGADPATGTAPATGGGVAPAEPAPAAPVN